MFKLCVSSLFFHCELLHMEVLSYKCGIQYFLFEGNVLFYLFADISLFHFEIQILNLKDQLEFKLILFE